MAGLKQEVNIKEWTWKNLNEESENNDILKNHMPNTKKKWMTQEILNSSMSCKNTV